MWWKDLVAERFNQQEGFAVDADKKEAKNSEDFSSTESEGKSIVGEAKETVASDYDKPLRFVPSSGSAEKTTGEPVDNSAVTSAPKKIEPESENHKNEDPGMANTEPNPVAKSNTAVKELDQAPTKKQPEAEEPASTTMVDMETIGPNGEEEDAQTTNLEADAKFDVDPESASNVKRAKEILGTKPPNTPAVGGEAGVAVDELKSSSKVSSGNAERARDAISPSPKPEVVGTSNAEKKPEAKEDPFTSMDKPKNEPDPLPIEPKEDNIMGRVADQTLKSRDTEQNKDLSADAMPPMSGGGKVEIDKQTKIQKPETEINQTSAPEIKAEEIGETSEIGPTQPQTEMPSNADKQQVVETPKGTVPNAEVQQMEQSPEPQAQTEGPKERKGWLARIFGSRKKREAKTGDHRVVKGAQYSSVIDSSSIRQAESNFWGDKNQDVEKSDRTG